MKLNRTLIAWGSPLLLALGCSASGSQTVGDGDAESGGDGDGGQTAPIDGDGDGVADTLGTFVTDSFDINNDGIPDGPGIDTNADG